MSKVVCPNCEGNGIEPGTGITFTAQDVDEWFGDDYEDRDSGTRAWATYGDACTLCHRNNVVSEEEAAAWEEDWDIRAEIAAERRWGY